MRGRNLHVRDFGVPPQSCVVVSDLGVWSLSPVIPSDTVSCWISFLATKFSSRVAFKPYNQLGRPVAQPG